MIDLAKMIFVLVLLVLMAAIWMIGFPDTPDWAIGLILFNVATLFNANS